MSDDLKLSSASNAEYTLNSDPTLGGKKKSSGCSCFIIGCLGLIAIILLPLIGGGVYFATMDSTEFGKQMASILINPTFSEVFKENIQKSDDLNKQQKEALLTLYDKFLNEYKNLPPQQKDIVHKNIPIAIKKLIFEPGQYKTNPPPELFEIVNALNMSNELTNLKNTSSNPNNSNSVTDTTLPITNDNTQTPTTQTEPVTEPSPNPTPSNGSQYDF